LLPGVTRLRARTPLPPQTDQAAFKAYPWFALFLDSHDSHIYDTVILRQAWEQKILFLNLPGHCTHLLQPLDSGVFTSFKTSFRHDTTWVNAALTRKKVPLDIRFFARLAEDALRESMNQAAIKNCELLLLLLVVVVVVVLVVVVVALCVLASFFSITFFHSLEDILSLCL